MTTVLYAKLSKEVAYVENLKNSSFMFLASCISQFQAPTSPPPGDPRGFALYCCPGAEIYT